MPLLKCTALHLGGSVSKRVLCEMAVSFRTPSPRSSYHHTYYQTSRPSSTKLQYKHYGDWDTYFGKQNAKRQLFVLVCTNELTSCLYRFENILYVVRLVLILTLRPVHRCHSLCMIFRSLSSCSHRSRTRISD